MKEKNWFDTSVGALAARARHSLNTPTSWLLITALSLTVFFVWLFLSFGPILWIETQYQVRRTLSPIFHHDGSLRSLFIPDLSVDLRGYQAENTEDGIVIPKIFIDEPIVYNVDPNDPAVYQPALRQGIAHASSTAFPDSGGLGYYFAHSASPEFRSQYNAIFYLLGKLEPGDEIFIWHQGERFEYRVSHSEVTTPEDTSFLHAEYKTEMIVLQTCWPPGSTLQRRLVFAKRV